MTFKQLNNYFIPISIFTIILLVFLNNSFRFVTGAAGFENRELAACESINRQNGEGIKNYLSRIQKFPKTFEDCYNDNFPFRNSIIALTNLAKISFFDEINGKKLYKSDNDNFFHTDVNTVTASTGTRQFSQKEIENYIDVFGKRAEFMNSNGIKYISMLVPTKNTMYPELLPPEYRLQKSPTKLDQIENILQPSGYNIKSLKKEMVEMKKTKDMFYSNDSHWNMEGVELAYQKIAYYLANNTPYSLMPIESFEYYKKDFKGDIPYVLGIIDFYIQKNTKAIRPKNPQSIPKFSYNQPFKLQNDRNVESQLYINSNKTLPKAVILADSYSDQLRPLLAENFSELYWIKSFEEFPYEFIKDYKPDVIISLFNESLLNIDLIK